MLAVLGWSWVRPSQARRQRQASMCKRLEPHVVWSPCGARSLPSAPSPDRPCPLEGEPAGDAGDVPDPGSARGQKYDARTRAAEQQLSAVSGRALVECWLIAGRAMSHDRDIFSGAVFQSGAAALVGGACAWEQ